MRRPRLGLAVLGGAAVGGALIRLGAAATAPLWFDEATVGLMGRRVLGGEFPAFFHGQTYMGALEAYLDAVPIASLGASVEALRLWPILTSLTHAGLAGLLARRIFGTGWSMLTCGVPRSWTAWASWA